MSKIDVISGFLGAGKTTFIKKLIEDSLKGEKVVLIENEFGEVGIDGGFLKDCGIEIKEMSQGCICCSLVGDFEEALKKVINQFDPDRIIIEPSGVGKLSDVMKAVTDASGSLGVQLNSAVTVVDASKCKMYMKNFGEFFNNQIQYAGTIVLTRTDLVDQKTIDEAVELIRKINPDAEIITTSLPELSGERLLQVIEKRDDMLETMRKEALKEPDGESEEEHEHHHHHHHHHEEDHEDRREFEGEGFEDDEDEDDDDDMDQDYGEAQEHHHPHHEHEHEDEHEHHHEHHQEPDEENHEHHHHHHHHGHDADEVFESIGETAVAPITREKLEKALNALKEGETYGTVLRAKGMIKAADKDAWYYFDLTPGQVEIREGAPDVSGKLCVIGSKLKADEIKKLFR